MHKIIVSERLIKGVEDNLNLRGGRNGRMDRKLHLVELHNPYIIRMTKQG
jgi:hypothetical protein